MSVLPWRPTQQLVEHLVDELSRQPGKNRHEPVRIALWIDSWESLPVAHETSYTWVAPGCAADAIVIGTGSDQPAPATEAAVVDAKRLLTRLGEEGLIGLPAMARSDWEGPLRATGCRWRRYWAGWSILQAPGPNASRGRGQRSNLLALIESAARRGDRFLIAEAGGNLCAKASRLRGDRRTVRAITSYLKALDQLKRPERLLEAFDQTAALLREHATADQLAVAAAASARALLRCGRPEEALQRLAELPDPAQERPTVQAIASTAYLDIAPQQALVHARKIVDRSHSPSTRSLGRLAYALRAVGTSGEVIRASVADRQTTLEDTAPSRRGGGYLDAALLGLDGRAGPALEALNTELTARGLSPLRRTDPTRPLGPDNLQAAHPLPGEDGGPRVTVLMAAYNAAAHLDTAVGAALRQTHRNLEILIIDDGSTDTTLAQAERWQRTDSRIRILAMDGNAGVYIGRNVALQEARGTYITAIDADDWAHPEQITRLLENIQARPGAVAAVGGMVRMTPGGQLLLSPHGTVLRRNHSSLIFHRDLIEQQGVFDPVTAAAGGDREFLERIQATFGPTALVERKDLCTGIVRWHTGSLTQQGILACDESGYNPLRDLHRRLYQSWHGREIAAGRTPYVGWPERPAPFWLPELLRPPARWPTYRVLEPKVQSRCGITWREEES